VAQRNLWRTANPWVPHEWVTMKEAWLRVHAALSENMRLTRRDLKAHLLAKRLVGAARIIAPDGSERCIIFEPAFWEPVELPYAYLYRVPVILTLGRLNEAAIAALKLVAELGVH
jgi:hypothetical protein